MTPAYSDSATIPRRFLALSRQIAIVDQNKNKILFVTRLYVSPRGEFLTSISSAINSFNKHVCMIR